MALDFQQTGTAQIAALSTATQRMQCDLPDKMICLCTAHYEHSIHHSHRRNTSNLTKPAANCRWQTQHYTVRNVNRKGCFWTVYWTTPYARKLKDFKSSGICFTFSRLNSAQVLFVVEIPCFLQRKIWIFTHYFNYLHVSQAWSTGIIARTTFCDTKLYIWTTQCICAYHDCF